MADLKEYLGAYSLRKALEADRPSGCFVLDVGHDQIGNPIKSHKHITEVLYEHLVHGDEFPEPFIKLYVIGDWNTSCDNNTEVEDSVAMSQSMCKASICSCSIFRRYGSNWELTVKKPGGKTELEQEWCEAVDKIANLIKLMPALKELTWISAIPFMGKIWDTLPTNMTKLVLDLSQPIRIERDGDIEYKSYIAPKDMKPLVQQTQLEELRMFGMHDSMQAVVWETAYRNVSEGGMRVVDLQMAAEPIVRMDHWRKAMDVVGLTVPKQDSNESEYKGIEGKGVLHHSFGTGEYLDAFCMRKARISAGLEESRPLPLWSLKLNGFVVDYLPFEHELSRIVLLTCGDDCIDSGLRAPRTLLTPHNRWSQIVNYAPSHCLIQWPNWTGVFDDNGDQRDNHGDIVPQESGVSTPVDEPVSPDRMPLTKESLELKELKTALEKMEPIERAMSMASNVSVCGSDVTEAAADATSADFAEMASGDGSDHTEPADDAAPSEYPELATVDGSAAYGSPYSMTASLILVNTASTMESRVSNDSSFDNVSPVDIDAGADNATEGSKGSATVGNTSSKSDSFKHKEQAEAFYRTQHNRSRASSSTGSVANSLRRTPNFERARSAEPSQQQQRVRFQTPRPYSTEPHPALRISRRTASAIRFVLEEALRVPHPFTPDLIEENAPMSDLTSGRAANGGARTTGGPVPVDRSNIRTPTQIMNARRQRAEVEEQRKAAEEERRRASAERRAQAVSGVAGAPTTDPGTQRQPQAAPRPGDQYVQYPASSGGVPRQPERPIPAQNTMSDPQDVPTGASQSRPRAATQSQQSSRPTQANLSVPATAEPGRRPAGSGHARRPSAPPGTSQAGPSATAQARPQPASGSTTGQARESTTSNFPHAFERWETLSSHWEGLTSYWIRRLEQNTDEVRREPLAQQLSRQITDLSAAGANLFHAVVELQRLRASSERKFQRWFFEHRQEQERAQEREAQLQDQINAERELRLEAEANLERVTTEKKNAERAVTEMKRELQISKEEARRAWEELGRREQEERDRTFSLREGQPTLVGGVQVVPMAQNMGRGRGHDDSYGGTQSGGSGIEQHYSYEEGPQSPTDTDPFTEGGRHGQREHDMPAPLSQGTYVPSGAASTSSSRPGGTSSATDPTLAPAPLQYPYYTSEGQTTPTQTAMSQPEAFYQQPGSYLHQESETGVPEDEQSYVTSQAEESEVEFALDERGNYIRDDSGRRIPYRSLQSPESDDYDVEDARRRELEHLQHYGTAATSQGGYATTSSGASHSHGYATSGEQPDYSGDGYGDEWVGMRHHHPTRLSDVPEEDERSRTSPSRASQASRGRLY
ncbi:hypothetical protein yc1106_09762 [Curvularia clavata]|uniref:Uncharacterized protein n=1 Tax=Curvularia clavata TaxID=95742 RepID=A0A9Q8ZM00_CURCL|nr:hypothetical protein yc1106_09762 [Curvularia clavata]